MNTEVADKKYTVDQFTQLRSRMLTPEELELPRRSVTSHEFIWLEHPDRPKGVFFSNDHLFGYGILPEYVVPCSMQLPLKVKERPGFEDGMVKTPMEDFKLSKQGSPHKYVLLKTPEELVDYLNQYA